MNDLHYPFIYIASLQRTGSTLLSEILTKLPYSFIFHEPHLGKNYFAYQENDQARLKSFNIDLSRFCHYRLPIAFLLRRFRIFGYPQDYMMREFKKEIVPRLLVNVRQIGVKEIKHTGWENYVHHFPNMKVVLTGRDPRDVYISMYRKWRRGTTSWKGDFSPQTVAANLNEEFQHQLALANKVDSMNVKYEALCTDKTLPQKIKEFVQSPIPDVGHIGSFVATHPRRANEYDIHGNEITRNRVNRWQQETDEKLLEDAYTFSGLMQQYCEFWQYDV